MGSSFIISSPASVDELSVPFNSMLPSPVSSVNKILSRASDASVSVPSSTSLVPIVSKPTGSPASNPLELVASNNNLWLSKFSL